MLLKIDRGKKVLGSAREQRRPVVFGNGYEIKFWIPLFLHVILSKLFIVTYDKLFTCKMEVTKHQSASFRQVLIQT